MFWQNLAAWVFVFLFVCLFVCFVMSYYTPSCRAGFLSLSGLAVGSRVALQGAYDSPAGLFLGPHPPSPPTLGRKQTKRGQKGKHFYILKCFGKIWIFSLFLCLSLSLSFLPFFFASFILVSLFTCFFVYLFLCLLVSLL